MATLVPVVESTSTLASQVFDVNSIRGITVVITAPSDGQALVYDSATNEYVPDTLVVLNAAGSGINIKFGV